MELNLLYNISCLILIVTYAREGTWMYIHIVGPTLISWGGVVVGAHGNGKNGDGEIAQLVRARGW